MSEEFIDIPLKSSTLDRYVIRTAIFEALRKNISSFSGNLLDVGCGKMPYKNFILENSLVEKYLGLDIENGLSYDSKIVPDVTWDGETIPFEEGTFDCAIATEVLEHCSEPEVVLKEVLRVLRPRGRFFFTVPFLWNLHEVPNDQYRYTPFSLERHLKNSGFEGIEIVATGGWHSSMAQMLGLWVRRSPMKKNKRRILSSIIKPIIKFLVKMDRRNTVVFKEGQMITGLYGVARKPDFYKSNF